MSKKYFIFVLIIVIIVVVGFGYHMYTSPDNGTATTTPSDIQSSTYPTDVTSNADPLETAAISDLIVAFGEKLQSVPLSASKEITAQAIDENYRAYVSTELLTAWKNNPSTAPGRKTSSPWPDHIKIDSIVKITAANGTSTTPTFTVTGSVIEITSVEVANGGVANSYPITLTVQNRNGVWLITGLK